MAPELNLKWEDMPPDPIFGWRICSKQPWLEDDARYEIREQRRCRTLYSVSWWHGNRGIYIGAYIDSIEEAKEIARKHLEEMLAGMREVNK